MKNIFNSIGITLSGGGYRASAYHLGFISYLTHLGVAENVRAISSVSGGTLTGTAYIQSLIEKKSFKEFFVDFYAFLQNTNMLEETLECLASENLTVPSGRKDLIVAASRVFEKKLTKKSSGKPFLFGDLLDSQIHVSEFIINTTELSFGLDFRFKKSDKEDLAGNRKITIPIKYAKDLHLSDIVAASTCFPGALEPLAFPDDFKFNNNSIPTELRTLFMKDGKPDPIAFMDGGIYDNQGIESLTIAEEKMDEDLDLIIVSDVETYSDGFFHFKQSEQISDLSVGSVDLILKVVIVLCLGTAVSMIYHIVTDLLNKNFNLLDSLINYITPLLLSLSSTVLILWLRNRVKKIIADIPLLGESAWKDIKKFTINQIIEGVTLRISSLFVLATKVVTKRIRYLVYNVFYNDKKYENKRVSNLIGSLKADFAKLPPEVEKPSDKIIEMTILANEVETTAWLEKDSDLPLLVNVGQFTICYNLIKYIVRVYGNDPEKYDESVKFYWNKLVTDWNQMVIDPDLYLKKYMD